MIRKRDWMPGEKTSLALIIFKRTEQGEALKEGAAQSDQYQCDYGFFDKADINASARQMNRGVEVESGEH